MMTLIQPPLTGGKADEPTTEWTRLDGELRMLCRGLRPSQGWSARSVTTFVSMPDDAEYQQALSTICRRLADEYSLEQTVRWQDNTWVIRFSRPEATATLQGGGYEWFGAYSNPHFLDRVARLCKAARHLYGARLRR